MKHNMKFATLFLSVSLLALGGCNTGGPKQTGGTVLGALAGGVIGAQFGGGTGRVVGASLGTLGGAMLGSKIGGDLDRKDQLERQHNSRHHVSLPHNRAYHGGRSKVSHSHGPQMNHEMMHKKGIHHTH